jgi:effector-binding domain-containing protein
MGMKRYILLIAIIAVLSGTSIAQNKKAEKEAAAKAQFDKAVAAIEAKDYVIIVDSYEATDRTIQTNTDVASFLSFEKESIFLQGIPAGNQYTNKLNVTEYKQEPDKKGNISIVMQVKGFYITAKIEIFMKKGGNYADVIISQPQGGTKRFSGELIPRTESKYFKRPGVV